MIYIIALLFSILFCRLSEDQKGKYQRIFLYCLSAVPLTYLSAFRYKVGTDYIETYWKSFSYIKYGQEINGYDFLMTKLCQFILLFTDAHIVLFAVSSMLIGFFVYKSIYDQSVNKKYSILLYVITGLYFMSLNQVKQFIGMSICLFPVKWFFEKKYFLFGLCMASASLFHNACIVFVLPFLLSLIPNIYKYIAPKIVIVGLGVFYFFRLLFFEKIFIALLSYTRFYDRYVDSSYSEGDFSIASFIFDSIILVFYMYAYKTEKNNGEFLVFYLAKIVTMLLIILSDVMSITPRIADTFFIIDIIAIPYLIKTIHNRKVKLLANYSIIGVLLIYFYWSFFILNNHNPFPYRSYFSGLY